MLLIKISNFAYIYINYIQDYMKQINWGFIGCGEVTEKKSGPAFNEIEGSQVVAVMSRSEKKPARMQRNIT